MQLKHKGKAVTVHITKPERRLLANTADLLSMLARIPCEQQKQAEAAWKAITEVAAEWKVDEE